MEKNILERIRTKARERLAANDPAHDYSHSERVENLALKIHEHEGGMRSCCRLQAICTTGAMYMAMQSM